MQLVRMVIVYHLKQLFHKLKQQESGEPYKTVYLDIFDYIMKHQRDLAAFILVEQFTVDEAYDIIFWHIYSSKVELNPFHAYTFNLVWHNLDLSYEFDRALYDRLSAWNADGWGEVQGVYHG